MTEKPQLVARGDWRRPLEDDERDWPIERWAWEFLRRNSNYAKTWEAYSQLHRQTAVASVFDEQTRLLWGLRTINDPALPEPPEFSYPEAWAQGKTVGYRELHRWAVLFGYPNPSHHLELGGIGILDSPADAARAQEALDAIEQGGANQRDFLPLEREIALRLDSYEVAMRFDLARPLPFQLELAKDQLRQHQNMSVKLGLVQKYKGARKRNYSRDIRVLDAVATDVKPKAACAGLSLNGFSCDAQLYKEWRDRAIPLVRPEEYTKLLLRKIAGTNKGH